MFSPNKGLFTYYFGIISLIISVLTYVVMEEPLATKIFLVITVVVTLVPVIGFIFIRPICRVLQPEKATPTIESGYTTPVLVHTLTGTH